MYSWDIESLEEEYGEWLEENCQCPLPDDECVCMEFNEWFEEKRADAIDYLTDLHEECI